MIWATASHFRYKPKSPAKVVNECAFQPPTKNWRRRCCGRMVKISKRRHQSALPPSYLGVSTRLISQFSLVGITAFGFCTSTGFVAKKTWILHVCIDLCIEDKVIPQGKNKDSNHQIEPFTCFSWWIGFFGKKNVYVCIYIYRLNVIISARSLCVFLRPHDFHHTQFLPQLSQNWMLPKSL